jgi:hypothetical protein
VRIQPIFKKGDPLQPSNYRPIAITSVLYRLYSATLTRLIQRWAAEHKQVSAEQFAFQRHRSTSQAAFVIRHLANSVRARKKGAKLFVAFVDFSAAYDSIDQQLLWRHLRDVNGMPANLLQAVQALYSGATYILRDGPKQTPPVPAARGIKQGCPLSPLLFSLYLSDLPGDLAQRCPAVAPAIGERATHCLLYADDLALLSTTAAGLQQLLDALALTAHRKRLTVNVGKTEVVMFGSRRGRKPHQQSPLQFSYTAAASGGTSAAPQQLAVTKEFKYLGLLQDEGNSQRHTMQGRSAAFAGALHQALTMARDCRLGRHLPTVLRLADVFARPAADYGCLVWGTEFLGAGSTYTNCLERRRLSFLRTAAGLLPTCASGPLLHQLGLQPLQRGWWRQVLRGFNQGVSDSKASSPLFAAAIAADMQLAVAGQKGTWCGQLLAALDALCPADSTQPAAARALQPISISEVDGLLAEREAAAWLTATGDPAAPDCDRRAHATYSSWFAGGAGQLVAASWDRVRRQDSRQLRSSLQLCLGSSRIAAVVGGWQGKQLEHEERVCKACAVPSAVHGVFGSGPVQDAQHVCFECPAVRDALKQQGMDGPPRGARSFAELFAGEQDHQDKGATLRFLAAAATVAEGIEGKDAT